jgi:hypothetical protein
MKITRALLLSSQKQAEAWERPQVGTNIFGQPLYETKYRFLVDDLHDGGNIRFRIFCVHREKDEQEKWRTVIAQDPHVDETFEDMGKLINFLRRYQIDFETQWEPVESYELSERKNTHG